MKCFKWLSCFLCRFDRVQFSLFPKSHPRGVRSWRLTRRQLVQQQPDRPEVCRAERKRCLRGEDETSVIVLVYLRCREAARRGETIRKKHTRLLSKHVALLCATECESVREAELQLMIWTLSDQNGLNLIYLVLLLMLEIYLSNITGGNMPKTTTFCTCIFIKISKNSVSYVYLLGQLILCVLQRKNTADRDVWSSLSACPKSDSGSNCIPTNYTLHCTTVQTSYMFLLILPWNIECCKWI